ncbi:hypothetical protein O3I_010855 [Nocardia brasiliensis ATCC 700358]|uniref:Uncharacterized protein n=1 Tax=Nocardia brasiliensis (strain ATCC 700358 / HUJEG-1) TaxID=1133849 RepID=K0ERH9_NOCB7|nr:hypothetical protein O3I_010855 [Nocardia brasiliensis ATCC 700358]
MLSPGASTRAPTRAFGVDVPDASSLDTIEALRQVHDAHRIALHEERILDALLEDPLSGGMRWEQLRNRTQ